MDAAGWEEEIAFVGEVIEWRGPAPFYFVAMPDGAADALRDAAREASCGWGCVPVIATIDEAEFRTSLIPRNGSFLLPLKAVVRGKLDAAPGEIIHAAVRVIAPAVTRLPSPHRP